MMWWKRLKKPNPEEEKKLREDIQKEGGLEKKDLPAMILSALITILPVCILVLGGFGLLILLICGAL